MRGRGAVHQVVDESGVMSSSNSSRRRFVHFGVPLLSVLLLTSVGAQNPAHATTTRSPRAEINALLNPSPHIHVAPPRGIAAHVTKLAELATGQSVDSNTAATAPAAVLNLGYGGGPVLQSANNSVPIFWLPPTLQDGTPSVADPNYASVIQRYFNDVGGNGLYEVNTQYYQTVNGPTEFIVNASGLIRAIIDTSAYPAAGSGCAGNGPDCLDDSQIRTEITSMITAHSLPTGLSTEYFAFTAPHESSCTAPTNCFKSDIGTTANTNFVYCAYHSFSNLNGQYVVYANMPYDASAFSNECTGLSSFPNNRDADIELSTTSHEQMEATTDPVIFGWIDPNGQENGDKCAYNYGSLTLDGGLANEQWNGHFYVLQQEWSNAVSGCLQGVSVGTPPGAPSISTIKTGSGWGDVAFRAPTSHGSSPITSYTVTASPGGNSVTVGVPSLRALLTGLANGTAYSFTVTAHNAAGNGPPSSSAAATPSSASRSFTTNWSASEYARLTQSATYLGTTPAGMQLTAVYTIAYVIGIVHPASPTPLSPPVSTGPNSVATSYTVADQGPLTTLMGQYAFSPSEAQYFAAQLVGYLFALGGH